MSVTKGTAAPKAYNKLQNHTPSQKPQSALGRAVVLSFRAMEELKYVPNDIARSFASGTAKAIAISGFFGQHQFTQWGYVFAMSMASLVPVLIVFILCQKYFVSGLQAGGVKG